jgi:dTDP-4-amino-4,6-dideoxygalactose transaminase
MIVPANSLPALISCKVSPITYKSQKHSHFLFEAGHFYSHARWALLSGLIQLGCKPGDSIAIPALFCESTLLPLKKYGFNLVFVDVDSKLQDFVDNVPKILKANKIDALLLVNYFGVRLKARDDIINACHAQNVKVIEDCSHSFLSCLFSRSGPDAEISIYSIRKNLAVADGGILVFGSHINRNRDGFKESRAASLDLTYLIRRYLEAIVIKIGWPNLYGSRISSLKARLSRSKGNDGDFVISHVNNFEEIHPSFSLARYLSNKDYLLEVCKKRIYNYRKLAKVIEEFKLRALFPDVSVEDVPQVFPVCDPSGTLVAYLRERGIGAYRWPGGELPDEIKVSPLLYPNAVNLNDSIVCLPIHQDINDKHVSYMKDAIADWLAELSGGGRCPS